MKKETLDKIQAWAEAGKSDDDIVAAISWGKDQELAEKTKSWQKAGKKSSEILNAMRSSPIYEQPMEPNAQTAAGTASAGEPLNKPDLPDWRKITPFTPPTAQVSGETVLPPPGPSPIQPPADSTVAALAFSALADIYGGPAVSGLLAKIPALGSLITKLAPKAAERLVGGLLGGGVLGANQAKSTYDYNQTVPEQSQRSVARDALVAGISYPAYSYLGNRGGALGESLAGADASIGKQTLGRMTGEAGGTVLAGNAMSLANRGELAGTGENFLNAAMGAGSGAVSKLPDFAEVPLNPENAALKARNPELEGIPNVALQEGGAQNLLDSMSRDYGLNPLLAETGDQMTAAIEQIARDRLHQVPDVELLNAGGEFPGGRIQNVVDGMVKESGIQPAELIAAGRDRPSGSPVTTSDLMQQHVLGTTPEPALPGRVAAPSSLAQGEKGLQKLETFARARQKEGSGIMENMTQTVEKGPDIPLPIGPIDAATMRARKILGKPVIPEGNLASRKTVSNVEKAVTPDVPEGESAIAGDLSPEEIGEISETMGIWDRATAALENPLSTRDSAQLLRDLTKARTQASGWTNKKVIRTLQKGVMDSLESLGTQYPHTALISKSRRSYAEIMDTNDVIWKRIRSGKTEPSGLGKTLEKSVAPTRLRNYSEAAGIPVAEISRNAALRDLGEKVEAFRVAKKGSDIPGLLDKASVDMRLPEDIRSSLGSQKEAFKSYLNQVSPEAVQEALDAITGAVESTGEGPLGTAGVRGKALARAEQILNHPSTPPALREAVGIVGVKNTLGKIVKESQPLGKNGPTISVISPKDLAAGAQTFYPALAYAPKDIQDGVKALFSGDIGTRMENLNSMADTLVALHSAESTPVMAALVEKTRAAGAPGMLRLVRDRMLKQPQGAEAWKDVSDAIVQNHIFGPDGKVSGARIENSSSVPDRDWEILTRDMGSSQVLKDLRTLVAKTKAFAPPESSALFPQFRATSSAQKTIFDRFKALGLGAGVGGALGHFVSGAAGIGAMGVIALAPRMIGKVLLSNPTALRAVLSPWTQALRNAGAVGLSSAGAEE